ncbi:hypothetical protein Y88_2022 [Novosphingobium nitrogenifigens DSM 19370]|uniref:Lipoprotein n=1 Tax=Novosphingobium nitrogenifigens DSM 19370 TaxID=983920 RepID=F1Z5N8_9SPHN|nr:hypothetical protein [Novosphingobium nitrogenifigens]EGD60148.1 hypothetical protein Y88_2022 [Novosphingobium nitrogenifigens DSM 19370]
MRAVLPLSLAFLLAACGGGGGPGFVPTVSKPDRHMSSREQGLPGVIGADAEALIRQFGQPRLDIREGEARKLQWSGSACILDAFLYPGEHGRRPTATYVDARRGDGRDVDKAACVAALRRN